MGIYLDGNDYIENTSLESLQYDFSVYVYAKVDVTASTSTTLVGSRSAGSTGWVCKAEQWNNTGKVGFTLFGVADYSSNIDSIAPTDWEGYVFVFWKDGADYKITYYVGSNTETNTIGTPLTPGLGFAVGAYHRAGAITIDCDEGHISEVAIWNTPLTAAEAQMLIDSKLKHMPLQTRPANLKVYWSLEDGAIDRSGAGNDGALTGGTLVPEEVLSYSSNIINVRKNIKIE